MSNPSASRRAQITLTSPKKAATLLIDSQYKSTQLTALFNYVQTLIEESLSAPERASVSPVYIFKHFKTLFDTENNKISGLEMDLIDIRTGSGAHSDSFFGLNADTEALKQIRRVFINNNFFISKYVLNECHLPRARILKFKHVEKREGFQGSKSNGKTVDFFYVWDTAIPTREDEMYHYLNQWNERMASFENANYAAYDFEYINSIDGSEYSTEEIEAPATPILAAPARKRAAPRYSKK